MRHPPLTTRRCWPPLIAVAHGSRDPRAAAAVSDLMSLVRARTGLDTRAAFLGHALPSVPDVLDAVYGGHSNNRLERGAPAAVVLPLLLTAAYHSDADLPVLLREATRRLPGLRISYGEPLGPHDGLLRALDRRLAEAELPESASPAAAVAASVLSAGPAPSATASPGETGVVLAAAGSSRPAANAAVARVAADWQRSSGWLSVVPAYASAAAPSPGEAVAGLLRAGVRRVVVASYLLAPGVFADQVRERSLAAGAAAVSAPLGAAPEVADVVIERYLQAAREDAELRVRYRA
jgi:sirohydrochlorin ferrochelatase